LEKRLKKLSKIRTYKEHKEALKEMRKMKGKIPKWRNQNKIPNKRFIKIKTITKDRILSFI